TNRVTQPRQPPSTCSPQQRPGVIFLRPVGGVQQDDREDGGLNQPPGGKALLYPASVAVTRCVFARATGRNGSLIETPEAADTVRSDFGARCPCHAIFTSMVLGFAFSDFGR